MSYIQDLSKNLDDKRFLNRERSLVERLRAQQALSEVIKLPQFQAYLEHRLSSDQILIQSDDDKEPSQFLIGKCVGRIEVIMELRSTSETILSRLNDLTSELEALRKSRKPQKRT
tara:strand:+ start:5304 stop:5648 length:345 start_codon:yes stop_codon:yes gene_type:complete